jgi:hypothetical protein
MGTDQHAQPGDQHRQERPTSAPPQGQPPGAPADPTAGRPDGLAGQFSFKTFLSGGVVALGLAFAAVGAGFSALRVIIILGSLLITSATAQRAYLAYRAARRDRTLDRRSAASPAICVISAALALAAFISWPFGSSSTSSQQPQAHAAPSSCDLDNLLPPQPVTGTMARVPLMYAVRSTDTVTGDDTAVAHQIYAGGWMQQVFLATGTQVATVSAVISLNAPSFKPFPIEFDVMTTGGKIIGTARVPYDGSTNNVGLHASFPKPVPLKRGNLYALRVTNESALTIAMYAHVYNDDPALTTPYPIPVCAFGSGDGGPKAIPILDDNDTYQVLSGSIFA